SGIVGGDDEIAQHGKLATATKSESCNRSHERLAHAREPLVVACIVGAKNVDVRLVCHLLDIGAGRKCFVGTGEEDAADIGIGVERLDRVEEVVLQRSVERIQCLRPVKTNDADAAASFDNDGFGAHDYPWLHGARARKVQGASQASCWLSLTDGTKKCRSAALHHAPDRASATRRRAGLAGAII